jgi:hypothetical protein
VPAADADHLVPGEHVEHVRVQRHGPQHHERVVLVDDVLGLPAAGRDVRRRLRTALREVEDEVDPPAVGLVVLVQELPARLEELLLLAHRAGEPLLVQPGGDVLVLLLTEEHDCDLVRGHPAVGRTAVVSPL